MDNLDTRGEGAPTVKRGNHQSCAARVWLTVVPNRLNCNGASILAKEWHNNVKLTYNHVPLDMLSHCDGFGAKRTFEHCSGIRQEGWCVRNDGRVEAPLYHTSLLLWMS